ncbi:hypothetical protein DFH01_03945 [Falsiroseomonas bella]|uniref:DUF5666 domain-containing protein n=1 Tax=Falsiroseomonas bella TaxID=2184016 RepID=A0A317FH95_9PROT|nr:hypothetical protein [Falsiroseomonas bella]PWS38444.1 hypothetical protein DFH01_03945 [Falsiroseomonas bella]
MPKVMRRAVLAAGFAALASGPAGAQGAPALRLRGRILAFADGVLTVATREGGNAKVTLPENAPVSALRRATLAELVPGANLGVVAEPAGEGLRAVAVTLLPATATRQFQSEWDLTPGSSMNNGAVAAVMERAEGHELTLTINGRSVPVRVDERTALVRPVPATRADLREGAAVFVLATRGADGALTAVRVSVEKDGVAPPT